MGYASFTGFPCPKGLDGMPVLSVDAANLMISRRGKPRRLIASQLQERHASLVPLQEGPYSRRTSAGDELCLLFGRDSWFGNAQLEALKQCIHNSCRSTYIIATEAALSHLLPTTTVLSN